MDEHARHKEDPPVLNVVQIVALNTIFCIGLLVTLRLQGLSWGASIGRAWIGGAVLTAATAVTLVVVQARSDKSGSVSEGLRHTGPELVDPEIAGTLQVWEADRLAEIEFSLDHAVQDQASKSKPVTPVAMARMWDDDAKADSEAQQGQIDQRNERAGPQTNARRATKG